MTGLGTVLVVTTGVVGLDPVDQVTGPVEAAVGPEVTCR